MRALVPLLCLIPFTASAKDPSPDPRHVIRDAMATELGRAITRLKLPTFEAPYFLAYTVRDYESVDILAKVGAVYSDDQTRNRQAFVEVRVGDYKFDNTADSGATEEWNAAEEELYQPGAEVPIDADTDGLRATLWLLTDSRYKSALATLHQKRGARATTVVEDEDLPSFAKVSPVTFSEPHRQLVLDRAAWSKRLRAASAVLKNTPEIFDSSVRLQVTHETRILVTSEGTRLITERIVHGLHIAAVTRAPDGVVLDHGRSFYGATDGELPSQDQLLAEVKRVSDELLALRKAPVADPYTGPAILMEEATGVLFHEVIGHRLEGERLGDEQEGQTFKGQIGQRVVPTFLDLVDDPTQRTHNKVSLNGWYQYDEEGVKAEQVVLIEKGILRSFLTSRRPVPDVLRSNGHGRADGTNDPMARMGNLIVKSSKQVSPVELKKLLLEEVRRQGKPYGLIIRDITGGNTNTSSGGYQAFKGMPRMVFKVDAKSGEETLVRGVEMVGTPLTAISKIAVTSNTTGIFNGYCGAESGYVPVSTVAPAVLMSEIELQRAQRVRQKPTILPPPWKDKP
jgi:TldD protein